MSGNLRDPRESILDRKISDCRAVVIIWNDININTIPWDFKVENPCFIFCVGDYVGGKNMDFERFF